MRSFMSPRCPGGQSSARCSPARPALPAVAVMALIAVVAGPALTGCVANPRPTPLIVATPGPTPTSAPATAQSPEPSPVTNVPPSRSPLPSPSRPQPRREPAARITGARVVTALRFSGIPGLTVVTQPSPRTRTGADTIFYTRPAVYTGTVRIRGTRVALSATPVSYSWRFGDGAGRTTTRPGAPYPRHTVTHVYRRAGVFRPSVTTSYRVRFRTPRGTWRTLPARYSVPGPTTRLTVLRRA